MNAAQREMPRYKSHKEVWALKINNIKFNELQANVTIVPEDEGYAPFTVSREYYLKHVPAIGGYYVVYADGYQSYSPAEAFEGGYTRIN